MNKKHYVALLLIIVLIFVGIFSLSSCKEYVMMKRLEKLRKAKVGDTIIWGKYEQDGNLDNGAEDIEWIILEKTEQAVLVISKYCLDYKNMWTYIEESSHDVTFFLWDKSELRQWLNTTFWVNSFSTEESNQIAYGKFSHGDDIIIHDQLFLLPLSLIYELNGIDFLSTTATPYASDKGCDGSWWTMDNNPNVYYYYDFVNEKGEVDASGKIGSDSCGVRPSMYIQY